MCAWTGWISGVSWLAPLQEGRWLASVPEYLYRLVCDRANFWSHQCCYNGTLLLCYTASDLMYVKPFTPCKYLHFWEKLWNAPSTCPIICTVHSKSKTVYVCTSHSYSVIFLAVKCVRCVEWKCLFRFTWGLTFFFLRKILSWSKILFQLLAFLLWAVRQYFIYNYIYLHDIWNKSCFCWHMHVYFHL